MNGLHPDRKLIIELHIEYQSGDRPTKLVVGEFEDPKLWTELLGRIAGGKRTHENP